MISFVGGDQIAADQDDHHICFASNAAIAKRTHVSVQTVERHISTLVELGLVRRVLSAKRQAMGAPGSTGQGGHRNWALPDAIV